MQKVNSPELDYGVKPVNGKVYCEINWMCSQCEELGEVQVGHPGCRFAEEIPEGFTEETVTLFNSGWKMLVSAPVSRMERVIRGLNVPEGHQKEFGKVADVVIQACDDGAGRMIIHAYLKGEEPIHGVTLPYPTEDDVLLFCLAQHLNARDCSTLPSDGLHRGEKWEPA